MVVASSERTFNPGIDWIEHNFTPSKTTEIRILTQFEIDETSRNTVLKGKDADGEPYAFKVGKEDANRIKSWKEVHINWVIATVRFLWMTVDFQYFFATPQQANSISDLSESIEVIPTFVTT